VSIPLKAQRFIDANLRSPLEYQSASSDLDQVTFRLRDGTRFELSAEEARAIDDAGHELRWTHLHGLGQAALVGFEG
jgi:hypothetical protein